ncbi:MAG: hypothetical protein M0R80_16500 [Proteobacteria bacterium]|jgi:hypothetical protein|nr:hypothetical protein [Pseudomonadota bacterium]
MDIRIGRLCAAAFAGALSAMPFVSAAQECYRPAECEPVELCINTVCTASEDSLPPCDMAEPECAVDPPSVCDDGYCKVDAVYCQNPAGSCYMENAWSACSCGDGTGSYGSGEPPDPLLTDEELYAQCGEILVLDCGEDAPDLTDECTEEQLATCTAYYDKRNALLEACGNETDEPSFFAMAQCCDFLEDGHEEFLAEIDCIMDLALEDCAEMYPACYPGGADGGVDDTGADSDADADLDGVKDSGSSDSGCSAVLGTPGRASLLVAILG